MPNLYDLTGSYKNIAALIDDPTMDEVIIGQALATIEADITAKTGNLALLIKCIDADCEAIRNEEGRLADRRRVAENRVKWVKSYIQEGMENAGLDKIKTPTFTIAIQKNPPAVIVDDMSKIPKQYITETISYVPDKKALSDALKSGAKIEGAHIEQGKSLRIR